MDINIDGCPPFHIVTPCDYRAEIYRRYLEEIVRTLRGIIIPARMLSLSQARFPNDPCFRDALQDRELLETLAKILDKFVMFGVAKDLEVWRKHNGVEPIRTAAGTADVNFLRLPGGPDQVPARYVHHEERGYTDYFNWYIAHRNSSVLVSQDNQTMPGVEAFYQRYPLIRHAVKKCAENFRDNIFLACERITNDWNDIGNIFFPGNLPVKVTRITCSGSDTHKGGKQVLFLTFQLSHGLVTGKLVYKPSDVEMDYRLVGRTDGMRGNAQYRLGELQSLTEIINDYMANLLALPTYRILPRSHGSTLVVEDVEAIEDDQTPILPVRKSYGYIEFLTHTPKATENGLPIYSALNEPLGDWVTDNPVEVARFYRQLGGFMAIISVFSLCDFHHENIIVHNRQPYLIDLENCFAKPISGFDGVLSRGLTDVNVWDTDRPINDTEGKVTLRCAGDWRKKASQNRICFKEGNGLFHMPELPRYTRDITDGFLSVIGTLRVHRDDLRTWLVDTMFCVARSVVFPTMSYYDRLNQVFSDPVADPTAAGYFTRDPFHRYQQEAIDRYLFLRNGPFGVAEPVIENYVIWPTTVIRPGPGRPITAVTCIAPIFALQTPENDFRDYQNCDIPAYYHQLRSTDLLNSRGKKVDININNNLAPGRSGYFPQSTWEIVESQLRSLGTNADYRVRVDECKNRIRAWVNYQPQHAR